MGFYNGRWRKLGDTMKLFLLLIAIVLLVCVIRILRKEYEKEKNAFLYLRYNMHMHDIQANCEHDCEHIYISYRKFNKLSRLNHTFPYSVWHRLYPKTKRVWIFHKVEICTECHKLRLVKRV